jgi:uncharacterized protein (DUF58 family)
MDASEIIKRIRKIEIKTRGLSKNIFSGEYHSAFKGMGMSFAEVRSYKYGDEVKNIDWNVTARTNEPHIKVFEEERELTVMLLIDISKSTYFGSKSKLKSDIVAEISAVLAFSAITNNDKVGAILFSDKIEKFIIPRKGKKHILRIIREIIYFKPESKGTDIGLALRYLNNVNKKRSIVFILSDFLAKNYETPLRIAGKKHDVIGIHIFDLAEYKLSSIGLVKVQDPETGKIMILDTSSKSIRQKYEKSYAENYKYFKNNFNKLGLDTIDIQVKDDYTMALLKFFKRRIK